MKSSHRKDDFDLDGKAERSLDEFSEIAERFHGHMAPGVLLGYHLVVAARERLPEAILFDAVCETRWCLPDVVQILTPCTVGNGWLRIVDLGLYAVSLYDKATGEGIRAWPEADKMLRWTDAADWYLKRKPKQEQRSEQVREQLRSHGHRMVSVAPVRVKPEYLRKRSKGAVRLCPRCGEAYPARQGDICRRCQGESPYV